MNKSGLMSCLQMFSKQEQKAIKIHPSEKFQASLILVHAIRNMNHDCFEEMKNGNLLLKWSHALLFVKEN